jgi:hypothetical protein
MPHASGPNSFYRQGVSRRLAGQEIEMDVSTIARVLWLRRVLRRRERWSRVQLLEHQRRELAVLRAFSVERSPFYRRFHAGLDGVPLSGLPVLTKATLMDHFDELATDPVVRLGDVQTLLRPESPPRSAAR